MVLAQKKIDMKTNKNRIEDLDINPCRAAEHKT
jgi:hypothetical protein